MRFTSAYIPSPICVPQRAALASVSLVAPHYPRTVPDEAAHLYDPADKDQTIAHAVQGRPDHGDMTGDHGLWTRQVMYETCAGVPIIVAGSGIARGAPCTAAASPINIAPTSADMPGTFMIRWDRWKYMHHLGHAPKLFDREAAPDERADRVADPACASMRSEPRARLEAICDPHALNQLCFADQRALGTRQACLEAAAFSHTSTPGASWGTSEGTSWGEGGAL